MRHLIRQGEGPAAALERLATESEQHRRHIDHVVAAAEANAPDLDSRRRSRSGATAAGDESRLRGIPALARGVGGAIPGTRPGAALASSDTGR